MKFELLPNEIFIVCFEYFNIFEIFHSFDRLNFRFYQLIRSLSLQLNFEHIRKYTFDQFCTYMLTNPEIKQQIYSLYLSNKHACGQIEQFFTYFSLDEFSQLQSLRLTEIEEENISTLKSMLPLSSHLSTFHIISHVTNDLEILSSVPMLNLRTLSILSLHSIQSRLHETFHITNLTISSCSLEHMFYCLFRYFPFLQYLNVRFVSRYNYPLANEVTQEKCRGMHLKQLRIGLFKYRFEEFEMFAQLIPNLQSLAIYAKDSISMINARHWENLIRSSLIYLRWFKFKFGCDRGYPDQVILKQIQSFQTDFWCKEHHWYTEYVFEKYLAFVYTIPCISNMIKLNSDIRRFPGKSSTNIFKKVTNVTLYHDVVNEQCQYYFPNVTTMELLVAERNECSVYQPMNVDCLKMIVNLSNLTHLNILEYGRMLTSQFLLEIFKQSANLSWITINAHELMLMLNGDDDEVLSDYLMKMIKKLDIMKYGQASFKNTEEVKRFCEIFLNLEQLECYMIEVNDILTLLNRLKHLSTINIYLPSNCDCQYLSTLFEEQSRQLNGIFRVEGVHTKAPKLSMWIGRNVC